MHHATLNPCTDKCQCVHAKYVLIIIIGGQLLGQSAMLAHNETYQNRAHIDMCAVYNNVLAELTTYTEIGFAVVVVLFQIHKPKQNKLLWIRAVLTYYKN